MSTPPPTPDTADRRWWYEAWETHMDGFLPDRDGLHNLLCGMLGAVLGPRPTIVELGSGTGRLAHRLASTVADATVVAVDLDPLLPAIGHAVLGDLDGRVRRRQIDLREQDWQRGLPDEVDAVVSVAALHELGADMTVRVLRDLADVLRPDGLLLDLDWAPPAVEHPGLQGQLLELARTRDEQAPPSHFTTHRHMVEADPELASLMAERRRRFGPRPTTEPPHLDAVGHRRALRDAGFAEVVELWRHLELALLVAVR